MSNRLLSLLVLVILFGGLFGVYYYFFVASTASISLIINGSGTTSVVLTSEFGNSSARECERICLFGNIPAVNYTVSAKRDGYVPVTKTFALNRGEIKKVLIAMDKEVILTEQKQKKEETIAAIKLKKSIQETMETNTGGMTLGYRASGLYYALPVSLRPSFPSSEEGNNEWAIFLKKEGEDAKELFRIPSGTLTPESLDIYEGYIALGKGDNISFYSLADGTETVFHFNGNILSIKNTLDRDTKIITSDTGVFMYTVSENIARQNPLYDDIIQLPSGEIVALVKKSSKGKQSLFSIADTSNDYVFLIGQDTRERKILLQTPKNGKFLRYKNGEILFVDENGEIFTVNNVK